MDQGTFILELARRAAWLVSESQNRDFLRARVEEFFRRLDSGCCPLPRPRPSADGFRLPAPRTLEALFPPYSPCGVGYDDFFLRDCVLVAIMHDGAWREDYEFDSERSVYFFEPVYLDEPPSNEPVTTDDHWAVMVYSELQEMPWLSTAEQTEAAKELIRQAFRRVEEVMPVEPSMEWEGLEPSSVFHDSVPRAVRKGWDPDVEAYRQRTTLRPPADRERVARFQADCSACTAYFAKKNIREHWLKQVEWHEIWSWGHEKVRPLDPDDPEDLRIIYAVMAFCMEKSTGTHVIPRCVIRGERRRFYTNPPVSAWICERGYSTWMRAYIEADLRKQGLLTAAEIVPRTNGSPVSGSAGDQVGSSPESGGGAPPGSDKPTADHEEPLTTRARIIKQKLLSLQKDEGMTLPQIQEWYETQAATSKDFPPDTPKTLDEGTWKRVRKELLPHGLKNRQNVGYYIPKK